MKDIPGYDTFVRMKKIKKGMSGERKYYIETKDGAKRLLRVAEISELEQKKNEFEVMQQLVEFGVPMPEPLAFGTCENGKSVFSLLSWIEGDEVEARVPNMSNDMQYRIGVEAGRILRKIHQFQEPEGAKDWETRYYDVMQVRLDAFAREGVPFEGDQLILQYLKDNRELLRMRPQCHHHGDFHMGNLIFTPEERVYLIDWHTVDFDGYGDPWYEFNRLDAQYFAYSSGQIDGYFEFQPPKEFWKLLSYYHSASAITSIVWAKYFAPDRLESIFKLNENILKWTDGFQRLIPSWYIGKGRMDGNEDMIPCNLKGLWTLGKRR